MKLFFAFFIALLFHFEFVEAQNISGFVYDGESEEPIIGATVYSDKKNSGTITDHYGFFSLNIQSKDSNSIKVSCIGYKTKNLLLAKKNNRLSIFLKKEAYDLQEIEVMGNHIRQLKAGASSLSVDQIQRMPSLTGESDLLKSFQLLSGVQSGSEGSVGLIVRGGSNDQNLYLLDGVPLYYVNHIGGVVSVFDLSAVKSATIYKGFFPASYGGRLSSVVDIVMKDGNVSKTQKKVSVGTLTSKVFIEGVADKKRKTTYIASARICNIGLLTMLNNSGSYFFYDVNAKITHRADKNNKLYFSFYTGNDYYIKNDKEKQENTESKYNSRTVFGNSVASVKWYHVFKSAITSNVGLTYSNFHNNIRTSNQYYSDETKVSDLEKKQSSMQDAQLKADVDFWQFPDHKIKMGLVSSIQFFKPQAFSFRQKEESITRDSVLSYKANAFQHDFYIDDTWYINDYIKLYAGLRLSTFLQKDKKGYVNIEPRVAFTLSPTRYFSTSIGYAKMSQYIHLLSNNDGGLPKDLWVPTTNKIRPEYANQYELEFQYQLSTNYQLSLSSYYKKFKHLIDYSSHIQPDIYWENNIETNGKGYSKGIEFTFAKKTGFVNGFVTYALSEAMRQFDHINGGLKYPFKYDHTHQLNILLNCIINKKITATAVWSYHTGNAITMAVEKYHLQSNIWDKDLGDIHVYGGRNSYRMPDYHRLDIGLTIQQKKGKWNLGIHNLYNRQNPYFYYFTKTKNVYKLKQTTLFPFLPSIAYTYEF